VKSANVYFTGERRAVVREEYVQPPGPDEVRIRASCTLISTGTELNCYARKWAPGSYFENWVQYPFKPGYSHVGVIEAVGSGVTELVPGMRVASRSPHHEYVCCPATAVISVPDAVNEEDAAWFAIASIVQNGVRAARHVMGESVVVTGLGILGQLVVQYARLSGAGEVIAVDLSPFRLDAARRHGATHTIELPVEKAKPSVIHVTGGHLADTAYDVTGFAPAFTSVLSLARTGGKVVLLGSTGFPDDQKLASDLISRGLTVVAAHDSNAPRQATAHAPWSHRVMQQLFFQYLERRDLDVHDLITHRAWASDAAEVYEFLQEDRSEAIGVLFRWRGMGG